MTKRWREFIEDSEGIGSASRLNMVVGVAIGGIVVLWLVASYKLTEGIFGIFMLSTGGVYGLGKWQESGVEREQIKANSPNPQPTIIPPVQPSPVTINTGNNESANEVKPRRKHNATINTRISD